MIYSFDVFDTCLARICGDSKNVFDILSLKVIKLMGLSLGDWEHMRQTFVAARMQYDGRLEDVYCEVGKAFPLPCSVDKMVSLEMETEKSVLTPIIATSQLIDTLRKKGQIIFISDMYLPSYFIEEQLRRFNFFKDNDLLFVSDQCGASKGDGSLYRLIHEQLGISYKRWYHYGDNKKSDYIIPRRLGIHAHWIHYEYLHYEELWRKIPVIKYPWANITAGISRAIRLQSKARPEQAAFVCDISAPVMVSWVMRILKDAQKRGIKHLWFCSRDCHTEYHIAKHLHQYFTSIEIHYLFISSESTNKNTSVFLNYLIQEGVASKSNPTAIVDSNSSGKTHYVINTLLKENGYLPCHCYLLNRCNIFTIKNDVSDTLHYETNSYYAVKNHLPCIVKMVKKDFIENYFSINFHNRTIGYEYHGEWLRPILVNDIYDNIKGDNIRALKKDNDKLAIQWCNAMIDANLMPFIENIFEYLAMPTLGRFSYAPERPYIDYLKHFQHSEKPIVCKLHPFSLKNRSLWMRGSLGYSLPSFIGTHLYEILQSKLYLFICQFRKK